jgi:hypothetical protein
MGMFAFRLAAEEAAKRADGAVQAEEAAVTVKPEPEQARPARKPRKESAAAETEDLVEPTHDV